MRRDANHAAKSNGDKLCSVWFPARLPHVVIQLHARPQFGAAAVFRSQPGFDLQSHFRADTRLLIDETGQGDAGNTQLPCSLGHAESQGGKHIFAKNCARMWWLMLSGHCCRLVQW